MNFSVVSAGVFREEKAANRAACLWSCTYFQFRWIIACTQKNYNLIVGRQFAFLSVGPFYLQFYPRLVLTSVSVALKFVSDSAIAKVAVDLVCHNFVLIVPLFLLILLSPHLVLKVDQNHN